MSESSGLQFVDTNVLIYAHDLSAGRRHTVARDLVRGLWQSGESCLSIQVLQEFYISVTSKVARPLTRDAAARVVADLSAWPIHRPGVEDVLVAIQLQRRHQVSFWDAMIIASATQMGCHTVWSEDLNPGQVYGSVRVRSPF